MPGGKRTPLFVVAARLWRLSHNLHNFITFSALEYQMLVKSMLHSCVSEATEQRCLGLCVGSAPPMLYTTRCEGARTKLCLTSCVLYGRLSCHGPIFVGALPSHIAMELLFQVVFQGNSLFLMFYMHIVDGLPAEVMFLLPKCLATFRMMSPEQS